MEFPETNWTILAAATLSGGREEEKALNQLCQEYWRPVLVVIKARGAPDERAEDLTQEFFVQLMKKGFFKKADRSRGSFRTFILGALKFFLADDAKKSLAQKRGGNLQRVDLNENDSSASFDESSFDSAWAELLFDRVYQQIEEIYIERRGEKSWQVLKQFLPGAEQSLGYSELGHELGLAEGGAKSEVFRMRDQFKQALRSEVARTVSAPHEIDEELAYLRTALQSL